MSKIHCTRGTCVGLRVVNLPASATYLTLYEKSHPILPRNSSSIMFLKPTLPLVFPFLTLFSLFLASPGLLLVPHRLKLTERWEAEGER
jgi:hypothetical protein